MGITLLAFVALMASPIHKAIASSAPEVTLGSDFKFTDAQHITGTVNGNVVTFYDSDVSGTNSIRNWQPQDMPDPPWCNYKTNGDPSNNQRWGINISSSANLSASTVSATIGLGYENVLGNNTSCTYIPVSNFTPSASIKIDTTNAKATLVWQDPNIVSSDGKDTYKPAASAPGVFINQTNIGSCEASGVLVTDTQNSGTLYALSDSSNRVAKSLPQNVAQYLSSPSNCKLLSATGVTIAGTPSGSTTISCTEAQNGIDGCTCTGTPQTGLSCTKTVSSTTDNAASNTSACVFKTNSGGWDETLSWILCPVVNGLSSSADYINNQVSGQLNFDVNANLGGSVKQAWAVFRTLASAVVVVVLLVMIISQAIGGGPFEAYTIKKLLPRLVAAIILMQVSWYLCIWMIGLANDAGQGIGGLLAAPFGGTGNLDLPSLLHRLSSVWAGIVGTGLGYGSIITALFFGGSILAFGWPILLLGALLIIIAVVVALATLLFRNAFLILIVILSPLAFLAYVLPGTDKYWKMWKDNFVRLLIFFPLVMAMIYGGRIFAWTAGNLGTPGPLDAIMVIVGFFGPYFLLPKSFKWGGTMLASVSKGINDSWPVKKAREASSRNLMATQQRKQRALVDNYYKSLVRVPGDQEGKEPSRALRTRAALKRGLVRAASGHPVPTARETQVMMQEAGKWKEEEIALGEGKMANDYKEFQKGDPANGIAPMSVQQAKEAIRNKYYKPPNPKTGAISAKDALSNRAFFTWAYDTKSFMEMGEKDWRTGADPKRGIPPQHEDMFKTQGWIDFMHGNGNAYGDFSSRLGASSVPYRLPRGGGPRAQDYLDTQNGKRYKLLDQPLVADEETGEMIPNKHYNPNLKKLIDSKDPRAGHLAELEADSERFTKLIDQAEDPAGVVSQRPEEFKMLQRITTELRSAGVESVGAVSLKKFIDEQSKTYPGRSTLQRLSGATEEHVDGIMGQKGYLEQRLTGRVADDEAIMSGAAPSAARPAAAQPAPAAAQPAPAAQAAQAPGTIIPPSTTTYRPPPGASTVGGNVGYTGVGQPTELKIDHVALANAVGDAVRENARLGVREGMKHALREAGLNREPTQRPTDQQQQSSQDNNDEDTNT